MPLLAGPKSILEVASGSGEHCVHWAEHFPDCDWQPSDIHPEAIESIKAWRSAKGLENIHEPLYLDVTKDDWPDTTYDAMIAVNMIHISPEICTEALLCKARNHLKAKGFLFLYGPFKVGGEHTAPSNVEFEKWLKEKDPRFGVRDLEEVVLLAKNHRLELAEKIPMPANNFSLVFFKD